MRHQHSLEQTEQHCGTRLLCSYFIIHSENGVVLFFRLLPSDAASPADSRSTRVDPRFPPGPRPIASASISKQGCEAAASTEHRAVSARSPVLHHTCTPHIVRLPMTYKHLDRRSRSEISDRRSDDPKSEDTRAKIIPHTSHPSNFVGLGCWSYCCVML